MDVNLPEVLPPTFAEKAELLDEIVAKGLEKLLALAKTKNYMVMPFGRKEDPTPLLSEEDFLRQDILQFPAEEDNPVFKFEYGFNPLKFLADYVLWSHPDSVKERQNERLRCVQRLQFLAAHANHQLQTSTDLRTTAMTQGSGIMWGPVISPLSSTSALCALQALCSGNVVAQVATDNAFTNIYKTYSAEVLDEHVREPMQPVVFILDDLLPNTRQYIRCFLTSSNNNVTVNPTIAENIHAATESKEIESSSAIDLKHAHGVYKANKELFYCQQAAFWTMPESGDESEQQVNTAVTSGMLGTESAAVAAVSKAEPIESVIAVTLACVPANIGRTAYLPVSMLLTGIPIVTCLLGDPLANMSALGSESAAGTNGIWGFHCGSKLMGPTNELGRQSSLLLAWNDTRFGSDVDVRSEEVTHRQFEHDLKKYHKKYPVSNAKSNSKAHSAKALPPPPVHLRPEISPSLSHLQRTLPIRVTADGAYRSLHQAIKLGPEIEVFCLDYRGGYMPKSQAKWLKESLAASAASWKVVLAGAPVAISVETSMSSAPAATADGQIGMTRRRNKTRVAEDTNTLMTGAVVPVSVPGTSDDAQTTSALRVSLLEPAPSERDDVDDQGRVKNSVHYVIASLQRASERNKKVASAANSHHIGTNGDDNSETGVTADVTATVSVVDDATLSSELVDTSTIWLDAGIVFITSNAPRLGLPQVPFIATFDPAESGRAFCAEVNIAGSGVATTSAEVDEEGKPTNSSPQYQVVQHMSTQFRFNHEAISAGISSPKANENYAATTAASASGSKSQQVSEAEFSAILKLESDGGLSVRLVTLQSPTAISRTLVEQTFRLRDGEELNGNVAEDVPLIVAS